VFGPAPTVFHATNLLLHLLNALLLFFILKHLFPHILTLLLVGLTLFFALHPINTEAFCWLSSRSTLLLLFLSFGYSQLSKIP
jgi:hypothetical protein